MEVMEAARRQPAHDTHTIDAMWSQYAQTGDPRLRDALVMRFQRLAFSIANRYGRRGKDLDDICQVAMMGLVKAVDRFDPRTQHRFTTFAAPTIDGEIKRYFRDTSWTLHVPRSLQELAYRVQRMENVLNQKLGREPTTEEVARQLVISPEQVEEARAVYSSNQTTSLDGELNESDDQPGALEQVLGRPDTDLQHTPQRISIAQELARLSELEREIIRLRYYEDLSQRDVGARLGLSQMKVSRLERGALAHLRQLLSAA